MDPDSSVRDVEGASPLGDSSDVCVVEVGSRTFVLVNSRPDEVGLTRPFLGRLVSRLA